MVDKYLNEWLFPSNWSYNDSYNFIYYLELNGIYVTSDLHCVQGDGWGDVSAEYDIFINGVLVTPELWNYVCAYPLSFVTRLKKCLEDKLTISEYLDILQSGDDLMELLVKPQVPKPPKLKAEKIIYNYPATIVYWADGTKTIVKSKEPPELSTPEEGYFWAYVKRGTQTLGVSVAQWCREFNKLLTVQGDGLRKPNMSELDNNEHE